MDHNVFGKRTNNGSCVGTLIFLPFYVARLLIVYLIVHTAAKIMTSE